MLILIVEDEASIAEGLKFNFEQEGYEARIAGDGPTALRFLSRSRVPIDLIVLDLMLPGMSGYEICKEIRNDHPALPILVLSARLHSQDRAHAFDCGADQYLTKPFDLNELLSRIRNLLNRRVTRSHVVAERKVGVKRTTYSFSNVRVECHKFQVVAQGQVHTLTTMEMQLLRYFIENVGTVLSRAQILEAVWDQSPDVTTRTIDNFVMRLRKLIEVDPSMPRLILSVRGTGYRFAADVQTLDDSGHEKDLLTEL